MADKNPRTAETPDTGGATPSTEPLREELEADDELTGRATGTGEDLGALFRNDTQEHFADGFSGGSDDDTGVAIQNDGDVSPDENDDEPASE